MNIQTFEYFIAVAESLNFTTAAQKYYISQPAMSRQITMLENEIGVVLLERDSKSVKLTESGEIFLENARKVVKLYNKTLDETRKAYKSTLNRIRIGVDRHEHTILMKLVDKLKKLDPTVQLSIKQYNPSEIISELVNEDVDIIFGLPIYVAYEETDYIKINPVCPVTADIILYKNHKLAGKDTLNIKELDGENLITFSEDTGPYAHEKLKLYLANRGININSMINVNSRELQMLMVAMEQGIAIILNSFYKPNSDLIEKIPINDLGVTDYMCAYLRNSRCKSLSLLIDLIHQHYIASSEKLKSVSKI